MSKTKGNVAGPDEVVDAYGADAVRLYILFMGPADQDMEWHDSGIEGMVRFVRRLWRVVTDVAGQAPAGDPGDGPLVRKAHETIRARHGRPRPADAVPHADLCRDGAGQRPRRGHRRAGRALRRRDGRLAAPALGAARHLRALGGAGHTDRLLEQPWPEADPALLVHDTFELVIQVNGRVRDRMDVPADLAEADLVERAKASEKVQAHLDGKEIRQTIVVPGKLVNLVVG